MQYVVREEEISPILRRMFFESETGEGEMRLLEVYPGVQVWSIDFHMERLDIQPLESYHYIKLNYCLYGSCEVPLPESRYVYIGPGALSVDCNPPDGIMKLPSGEYTGLEIVIDLQKMQRKQPPAWIDCGISAFELEQLLQKTKGSYLAPATQEWASLAKEMLSRMQESDGSLEEYRFRLLQLMYLLKADLGHQSVQSRTFLTRGQREIVLRAQELFTRDLRQRYSITEAAVLVGVSPASLKKYFTIMFGMPISVYLRRQRIAAAKQLLTDEKRSIADVASEVGYENQGKFGTVFRRETGMTPLEYRRRYRGTQKGERI